MTITAIPDLRIADYPTEKPLALLSRIIEASSNTGDLVMDCYMGSGTTLVAAAQLGRRWIGVDRSDEAIATTLRRFEFGAERMGDFVNKPSQKLLGLHDPITDFSLYRTVDAADESSGSRESAHELTG